MGGKRGGGVRGRVGVSGGGDVEVGGVGWWSGVGGGWEGEGVYGIRSLFDNC